MKQKLTSVSSMNSDQPSWRIVSEWEQIIAQELNLKLKRENKFTRYLKFNIIDKYGLIKFLNIPSLSSQMCLRFIMKASTQKTCFVNSHTIPVIIDFWLEEQDLQYFYKAYQCCPLILVTNREVYDFLKKSNCPLNIEHWPLSFPDQYALTDNTNVKQYEFCIFGRPNPFFIKLLDEYALKHNDFEYILNNGDINNRVYISNKGNIVAKDNGRQSYLDMIKKTKISCYTTPGIDESKTETKSYNQVTPRLFEMLCNGCMVIGRYPNTADTIWYNLKSVVPNVSNYIEFEEVLDRMRASSFNVKEVQQFMNNHYTSSRARSLRHILNKHNISIC